MPEAIRGLACDHLAPIYPCMKVLPMGFSWAFHLAHEAHVYVAGQELPLVPMIRDKRELQRHGVGNKDTSSSMLIYADNCNHLGVDQQQLFMEHGSVIGALGKHGLETHDIVEPAESLGVRIDGLGGFVTSTASRDWRLHRAIDALLQGAAISGAEMQVIVGHLTIRAMLHRGLLCVLRHVYIFIEQNFSRRKRLWGCVREELWIFKNLMVLGFNNMKAQWDGRLTCTDACLSGYAVMEMKESMDTAPGIGRTDERWRFKRAKSRFIPARVHALQSNDVFEDPSTVLPEVAGEVLGDVDLVDDFPEIPAKYMDRSQWYLLWRSKMRFKEPVHLIEARSILGAVRHRARDPSKHGKHIVVLNDNMSVVLAMQKGRCSNYGLLRILRRTAAHCFAAGIRLRVRWLPSERNVADEDSRFWEPGSKNDSWKEKSKEERSSNFQQGRSGEEQQENDIARRHRPQEGEESIKDERAWSTAASRHEDGSSGVTTKNRKRGLQRKKKYAVRLRASRGEKSLLEAASVKAPQRKDYSRRLEQFYAFVLRYELPIQNENQLDEALCEFADHLFLDGEDLSFGQKLQAAAIEYERPEFAREGRLALPRFKRAMKGWRRLNPQQTRLPMPEFLKSAISAVMVQKGWLEEALFNETTFSTYARPGETLRIFAADIVEKNADFDHTVIALGPLERGESSKVGIYDETLVLDDSRAPLGWGCCW